MQRMGRKSKPQGSMRLLQQVEIFLIVSDKWGRPQARCKPMENMWMGCAVCEVASSYAGAYAAVSYGLLFWGWRGFPGISVSLGPLVA